MNLCTVHRVISWFLLSNISSGCPLNVQSCLNFLEIHWPSAHYSFSWHRELYIDHFLWADSTYLSRSHFGLFAWIAPLHFTTHFLHQLHVSRKFWNFEGWVDSLLFNRHFYKILAHILDQISKFFHFTALVHLTKSVLGRKVKNIQCFHFQLFPPWQR